MKSILIREIKSFFGSPIGYLVIALFLLLNGLFLWVFEGEFNILNSGFADMTPFFTLAPWILIFLIPAVTMRSFSDEKKQGTIELLMTKPLRLWQIVNGKFLGAVVLIALAILPTLIYVYVISNLGMKESPIDLGSTLGSYFGLLFLIAGYASIGVFCSTLSENQIVAFIVAVFICFLLYYGFEGAGGFFDSGRDYLARLGMEYHFKSMGRGVIDTRDVLYFLSVSFFFLMLTVQQLKVLKIGLNGIRFFGGVITSLISLRILLNIVNNILPYSFENNKIIYSLFLLPVILINIWLLKKLNLKYFIRYGIFLSLIFIFEKLYIVSGYSKESLILIYISILIIIFIKNISFYLNVKKIGVTLIVLVIINIIGNLVFKRFDLTADRRYTLSDTSINIVNKAKEPLYIDVYLEGNFPGEFKKLQSETQQLLEEFKAKNSNVIFQFINPLKDENTSETSPQKLYERGLTPINITLNYKGKQTEEMVFPWAEVRYGDRITKVPLLKNMMGASTAQKVESSVQHLEYAFSNGFNTLIEKRQKKIAVIKGNGELHELQIGDFLRNVKENYFIGPFTLDSVASNPNATLKELQKYDLAIIAKPTEAFTDSEKEVLDQFMVNGGKSLWVLDPVTIEMDSLMQSGEGLAIPRDLNLDDLMFKYGVRFKSDLVQDVLACPITLATGQQGSSTQYNQYPWLFAPAVYSDSNHPIVTNLDMIKFDFCSPIEILQNDIKKTILLHSSNYSKALGTPLPVNLNSVADRPEPKDFPKGFGTIPLAVLLEGNFHSVYENRILPFKDATFKAVGKPGKMIVISDGDVVKNQLDKDFQPLELGYDKWTGKMYANKEFLLNCVNYLLDDTGLINIRTKEVHLALLDSNKVKENYTQSQIITVAIPLFILGLFGWIFTVLRKRQYAR